MPLTDTPAQSGLGTRCAEAQADGVPCPEPGSDCAICGHALPCVHVEPQPATLAVQPPPRS